MDCLEKVKGVLMMSVLWVLMIFDFDVIEGVASEE